MTTASLPQPAVFIDRDGTLVEEVDFLSRVEDLRMFDFTQEALSLLKSCGYLLIVVTNQSGIGRGVFDEAAMHEVNDAIHERLPDLIDALYFCPHHPEEGCSCRKPGLGMITDAAEKFNLDLANSWIIGDKKLDVHTGFNAGMGTALVLTGYGESALRSLERMPDIVAGNLLEAAREICSREGYL